MRKLSEDKDSIERFHPIGEPSLYNVPKTDEGIKRGLSNPAFQRGVRWRSETIAAILGARHRKWPETKIRVYLTALGVTKEKQDDLMDSASMVGEFLDSEVKK